MVIRVRQSLEWNPNTIGGAKKKDGGSGEHADNGNSPGSKNQMCHKSQ
jgi:hypothetical protein